MDTGRTAFPQHVNDGLLSGNIATHTAKTLGKGAHHNVNVGRIDATIFRHPPTGCPHAANAVRLVEINVSAVLFAQLDDTA
jgi:hypothetical protein